MAEEDNWGTVEIPDTQNEDNVEYEIEEEKATEQVAQEEEPKPDYNMNWDSEIPF